MFKWCKFLLASSHCETTESVVHGASNSNVLQSVAILSLKQNMQR
ncbi:hypothetical protein CAter282_1253 [Collimonas arenae]|uniref:Uncharacterized protein n=1 Tax=Collimonas arenae TaxID=279058 RepID=A0A127PNG6_9BURK|nr:hypothetical protein CAter10_1345 [Collimonas arenae]AMP09045.1 hypothetical protein CAter282_1253 [Collimonas arenae]